MCPNPLHCIALSLAIAWTAAGQSAMEVSPQSSILLPADLGRVLRDYERAWAAKDTAALAALFTTDGFALPNGRPPARGRTQIETEYQKSSGSTLSLRALTFAVTQGMAYIVGGFSTAPGKLDVGKFLLVLRRASDGLWRIEADIDNSNTWPRAEPRQLSQ